MALIDVLKKSPRHSKILIFCNRKTSCERLHDLLKQRGIDTLVLHGGTFTEELKKVWHNADIVISTDFTSRGMDTRQIQHVILFDFPTTLQDYLHRVGRTARAGKAGRVTSLVGRKDEKLKRHIQKLMT